MSDKIVLPMRILCYGQNTRGVHVQATNESDFKGLPRLLIIELNTITEGMRWMSFGRMANDTWLFVQQKKILVFK